MNLDRDELINLAFDELDESRAQVLAARLVQSEDAYRELEELRRLRGDLKALRNSVPELRFSAERMKLAIGAAGKPKATWYSKLWPGILVPVAGAACFLLAATVLRPQAGAEPKVVLNLPQSRPIEDLNVAFNAPALGAPALGAPALGAPGKNEPGIDESGIDDLSSGMGQLKKPAPPVIANGSSPYEPGSEDGDAAHGSAKRVRPASKRIRHSETVAHVRANNRSRSPESTPVDPRREPSRLQPDRAADRRDPVVASLPASKPEEATIVIIQPGVDAGNGSSIATEVTNPTHVVIGG